MSRYIDRDEPLGEINRHKFDTDADYEFVWNALTSAETLDVAPVVHGEWLKTDAYPHKLYCSCCFRTALPNAEWAKQYGLNHAYCPNCGAKMDLEDTADV